jgi:ADP-ribosylglycohydrolase
MLAAEGVATSLTGRTGATNGAAMRVAPVGIAFAHEPMDALIEAVVQSGHVTHNTTIGIAGAAAVAAAVSAGIAGAKLEEVFRVAIDAARLGARCGFYYAGADVATRISWAIDLVKGRSTQEALDLIYRLVGTGVATQEAVPAAIAICSVAPDDPWLVCRLAASLGGDCDTVAAIAGAIVGACHGSEGFPRRVVEALHTANPDLALDDLANRLLLLRTAAANFKYAQPEGGLPS